MHRVLNESFPVGDGNPFRVEERDLHVFIDRQPREKIERLEDESHIFISHVRKLPIGHIVDALSEKRVAAAGWAIEEAQYLKQSGFAGTGRAYDGNEIALFDLERNTAQR